MIIEVNPRNYSEYFPSDPHAFISRPFTELNSNKVEKTVSLVINKDKPQIGLIAGIKTGILKSPFSAPFGGFHFRNEVVYVSEIDFFLSSLKDYISTNNLSGIDITIPPDLYHTTFNAKTINSLIRNGFNMELPEVTNWIDLCQFNYSFNQKNSREYYRQALRNNLSFECISDSNGKLEVYNLIAQNRAKFGRPIYMTLKDLNNIGMLWPVDFFSVRTVNSDIVASGIFYRNHGDIVYAVFWGDNDEGRPLRAMDFLAFNLWTHYKKLGYKYIDLGISTEAGYPNEGLLRFKESHNATSSLRYRFTWKI